MRQRGHVIVSEPRGVRPADVAGEAVDASVAAAPALVHGCRVQYAEGVPVHPPACTGHQYSGALKLQLEHESPLLSAADQQVYGVGICLSWEWYRQMQSPVIMAVQMLQRKRTASSPIEGCNTSSGALVKPVQA